VSNIKHRLYVAGRNRLSEAAISNLQSICENDLGGEYEMEVIDVLERPQLAEDERILATPTVVKNLPLPLRSVVGDLSDRERVIVGLDIQHVVIKHASEMPDRSRKNAGPED